MAKFLWSLTVLLVLSLVGGGYLLWNIDPIDTAPWGIVAFFLSAFLGVFSFVSLFLFFLSEIFSQEKGGELVLNRSVRRGLIISLLGQVLLFLQLFKWAESLIVWAIVIMFVCFEIYFSYLRKK